MRIHDALVRGVGRVCQGGREVNEDGRCGTVEVVYRCLVQTTSKVNAVVTMKELVVGRGGRGRLLCGA